MLDTISKTTNITMKETLLAFFIAALTIIAPIKAFIFIIILFVFGDTSLGIYATIKLNGLNSFKSNKLFNFVIKSFFYMGGVLLAFLIDKYIFGGEILGIKLLMAKSMTLLFSYIELKSLDETSIKLGHKSIWILFKEMIGKGKDLKEDLSGFIDEPKKD